MSERWIDVIEPLARRYKFASEFGASFTANTEGCRATHEVLTRMARKLDEANEQMSALQASHKAEDDHRAKGRDWRDTVAVALMAIGLFLAIGGGLVVIFLFPHGM